MGVEHYHGNASLQDLRVSRVLKVGSGTCAGTGEEVASRGRRISDHANIGERHWRAPRWSAGRLQYSDEKGV